MCEHEWIFHVTHFVDNNGTLLLDMRLHFVENRIKFSDIAAEHGIKQVQLVKALLLQEMDNALILFNNIVCSITNESLDS